MADEADDLLTYGIAAAQANSRDEARNYLEWVLRTDADLDQQAQAWYWLSTITDDRAEKRSCLENVLAINPAYPEARRDLAILDGRLKVDEITDPRVNVQPLAPDTQVSVNEVQSFKCPRCGARMTADRTTGALSCGFCGYRAGTSNAEGSLPATVAGVKEQDWVSTIYTAKGQRWEIPTERTFKCSNCGANVLLPPGHVSILCPFCGTPSVVQSSEEQHDLLQPTGLLPFHLSVNEALVAVTKWLGGQRHAPQLLGSSSTQATPKAVYVPCWTFDIEGEVRWTGSLVNMEFRRVTKVPTSGTLPLLFMDVLVPGTKSVPADIMEQISFDMHSLVPYSTDLLASWPAEIYTISPAEASLDARDRVLQRSMADGTIKNDINIMGTVEDLVIAGTDLAIISYKLVLVPVWIGSYLFEGQTYQVVVNGNSGEVEGNVPRSAWQTMLNHFLG